MNTLTLSKQQESIVRAYLRSVGARRTIAIGRSSNSAGVGSQTPIYLVDGDSPPQLLGLPYLKTQFSNGRGFSMTLYTPSTLYVEVGVQWFNENN